MLGDDVLSCVGYSLSAKTSIPAAPVVTVDGLEERSQLISAPTDRPKFTGSLFSLDTVRPLMSAYLFRGGNVASNPSE